MSERFTGESPDFSQQPRIVEAPIDLDTYGVYSFVPVLHGDVDMFKQQVTTALGIDDLNIPSWRLWTDEGHFVSPAEFREGAVVIPAMDAALSERLLGVDPADLEPAERGCFSHAVVVDESYLVRIKPIRRGGCYGIAHTAVALEVTPWQGEG